MLKEIIERIHGDRVLNQLASIVQREGVTIYLVGGAIRDLALDRSRGDYDFILHQGDMGIVHKLASELKGHLFSMGKDEKQRIHRVLVGSDTLDFSPMDGATIAEDLEKRDFTMNAMAYCLHENRFYSYPGAENDIEKKLIRMVSPEGFDRDPLRMLRAVRYLNTLEKFRLDERTKEVIRQRATLIKTTPVERIKMELDRILLLPKPHLALRELVALGLLTEMVPELRVSGGQQGEALLRIDAFSHFLRFLRYLSRWNGWEGNPPLSVEERLILSYAALVNAIGKILTTAPQRGVKGFLPQPAPEIMTRMKCSNRFKETVQKLINHYGNLLDLSQSRADQKALRQFIHLVGAHVRLLIAFSLLEHRAGAHGGLPRKGQNLVRLCRRIGDLCTAEDIISPPPLITGWDVIRLGYEPGPVVGNILHRVREKQIRGEIGTRQQALAYLRKGGERGGRS
jgi:tRNA nucleotidyltransferase/poly(A) polymerase